MWLSSASTVPSLFQNGNYFDNTGVFTVPITGYYFIAAQVRLDNIDSRYIRLIGGSCYAAVCVERGAGVPFFWHLYFLFLSR